MSRPRLITGDDRNLLDSLFAERQALRRELDRISKELNALSNKSLAEKFETTRQTMNNYARHFDKRKPMLRAPLGVGN